MNIGSLVKYRNTPRIPRPMIGIIVAEDIHAIDSRFFRVLLSDGGVKLISEHYLELLS